MLSLIQLLMVAAVAAVPAVRGVKPVAMHPATQEQTVVIRQLLGDKFVKGEGAFPPELLAASVDLNGDGVPDLITMQRGFCSNHTCDYLFYLKTATGWRKLTTVENWGDVYLLPPVAGPMKRIVFFDHVTDDCMACSAPEPVWLIWHPDRFTPAGEPGDYIRGPVLTRHERKALDEPEEP